MRLGQLARQVGVSPKEILRKLNDDFNVEIKAHPNAKIPDELLNSITKAFTPDSESAKTEETPKADKVEPIVAAEPEEKKAVIKKLITLVESVETGETTVVEGPLEKIETEIPVLNGPKIIGKIEISEFELRRIAERNADRLDKPIRVKRPKRRPVTDKKSSTKTKRDDSLEEKKKKEAAILTGKRKKSADSLKELNKKNYLEKSKSQPIVKTKKKKIKKKIEAKQIQENVVKTQKKKPTSAIGKLWSWLNDA